MKFIIKSILSLIIASQLIACTTTGTIYTGKSNEEFSVGKTAGLVIGTALAVAVVRRTGTGGGGGSSSEDPKWDYQYRNYQWVCRNASNGQYLELYKCNGQAKVDNWPGN